ncbi:MAG TPA: class I SAM-dependent methyltransferase [Pyrinomonadaceae bacterium]
MVRAAGGQVMASEYDSYVRAEWEMFVADAARARESLEAVAGLDARRVLDVGCGAGQELLPFAARAPVGRVFFVRAAAESLPFAADSFDVVICRLALPYTDNARSLSEMARVLRPGGALLLKIHHPRFYVRDLGAAARRGDVPAAAYNARVLLAGLIYLLTGRQPRTRLPSSETFQTTRMLRRELDRRGLEIRRELRDSNPRTPSFLIVKTGSR